MTKNEIFLQMQTILADTFELSKEKISMEAQLLDDLDLDSIDAVDLIVHLQKLTGKKIDPEAFKKVRTVGDVVDAIYDLVQSGETA